MAEVKVSAGLLRHCWAIDEERHEEPRSGALWDRLARIRGSRWTTVDLGPWEVERLTAEVSWQLWLAEQAGTTPPAPLRRFLQENGLQQVRY